MFEDLIEAIKEAFKKVVERVVQAFKELKRWMRCSLHQHDYAIKAWRYADYRRAIIAHVECPHCGAIEQKLIYDPRTIDRIKKRAGALRVERWKKA